MTKSRNKRWDDDTLLDPMNHFCQSRLLLAARTNPIEDTYEVTIVEWAPSKRRVKLRYTDGRERWVECWDYDPVVIEVLPSVNTAPDNWQRFKDGSLKPFIPEAEYDKLRDDDKFLYNRGPKPENLK